MIYWMTSLKKFKKKDMINFRREFRNSMKDYKN